MTTIAEIHDANTANETSMATMLADMGTQLNTIQTALTAGDLAAINAGCTVFYQMFSVLNAAANQTLTDEQYEHTLLAGIGAGAVSAVITPDGEVSGNGQAVTDAAQAIQGTSPAASAPAPGTSATVDAATGLATVTSGGQTATSPAPGTSATVDAATGLATVTSGGQTATSPAPTGQMPIGTTTGLQPVAGSNAAVPTEGDPVATAAAAATDSPASTAPLANGGGSGIVAPDGNASDSTTTVAGGSIVS